jgi:VIT1/CCC1 family predicted Fe2+/Mn2+ transporter
MTTDHAAWLHHLADEADAAFLYRELARSEKDAERSRLYRQLAEVEDRHVAMWRALLAEQGQEVPVPAPSAGARFRAWTARRLGPARLLPMLLEEEGREVKGYLDLHRETPPGAPGGGEALLLARESAEHATTLAGIAGRSDEPWHRAEAGGMLRNVVYGFNDGLTANFGLVAGMIGAQASMAAAEHAVLVAGLAGTVADALSMGASGYLAAKSEREVFEHEIAMEREEIRLMPELEREELSLIYQAKGIPEAQAASMAAQVMARHCLRADGDTRHGARRHHSRRALPLLHRPHGDLGVVRAGDGVALRRRGGAQLLHRPRHFQERARHVPRRPGGGRRRLLRGRVDRAHPLTPQCSSSDSARS